NVILCEQAASHARLIGDDNGGEPQGSGSSNRFSGAGHEHDAAGVAEIAVVDDQRVVAVKEDGRSAVHRNARLWGGCKGRATNGKRRIRSSTIVSSTDNHCVAGPSPVKEMRERLRHGFQLVRSSTCPSAWTTYKWHRLA